jgi:hypothetical protein
MPWEKREKIKDCNRSSRSIFGSTSHCIITTIITRSCYLGKKNRHNLKAAASRNLLLYDYYIKLYLLVLHTYEYVLQHTHSKRKRTIWSEKFPKI